MKLFRRPVYFMLQNYFISTSYTFAVNNAIKKVPFVHLAFDNQATASSVEISFLHVYLVENELGT